MNKTLRMALGAAGLLVAVQAAAQVTFYERERFGGRSFNADREISNLERFGFNDKAASAVVDGGRWEVCEDARFSGRCVVLQPGRYNSLSDMGLKYQISSVRPVEYNADANDRRGAVDDRRGYVENDRRGSVDNDRRGGSDEAYRRRANEDVYTADVTAVHAVLGQGEQRCWVEREQIAEQRNDNGRQVGGAIAGAVIGGILGHQIGGGRGRDVATAAGAVGGGLAGSNLARGSGGDNVSTQDVQRCRQVSNDRPSYYDVTYFFRGQEHHVQMSAPPGPTIAVNGNGEPRI
jgi:uncharacterized protein YcfJ